MSRKNKISRVGVVGLALVIGLGACSSSKKASSSSNTTAPPVSSGSVSSGAQPQSAQTTGSPIKIGAICSCSGAFGSNTIDGWKVLQAWSKWVNANGGLNGHPVDLLYKDDAGTPGVAVAAAETLVSDHVQVIFDLSILDTAWAKTADAANIPVVGGDTSFQPSWTDPNFYPSVQTNDSAIYASLATAKTAGATNVALFNCAEGCNAYVDLENSTAKQLNLPVVYSSEFSATAPNYIAQCVAAQQAKAQAIFLTGSISVISRVASDCAQQNYNPTYITEGTGFTNQALTATGLKDHLWSEFPAEPYFSTLPAVQQMNTVLDKYSPGLIENVLAWSEYAEQAWTGALALQAAAKNAGFTSGETVTAADFTKGLNMISNDTLGGIAPSLTFTPGKAHPVDCWYTARLQNGKPRVIGGQICHSVPAS